jgi:hypothetical protein
VQTLGTKRGLASVLQEIVQLPILHGGHCSGGSPGNEDNVGVVWTVRSVCVGVIAKPSRASIDELGAAIAPG